MEDFKLQKVMSIKTIYSKMGLMIEKHDNYKCGSK